MIGVTSRKPQTQEPEPLTREEEYDLIQRSKKGSDQALRQLILKYKRLIYKEVQRYESQVDKTILVTSGETAVFIAVKGFNLSTGNRLSTYLVPTIRTEVQKCVCCELGISRRTLRHLGKISTASSAIRQKLGREATLEEIAEHSKLSQRQILNASKKKAFAQPYSLNQGFTEAGSEWLDSQSDKTVDPWSKSEEVEILDTLDQLESGGCLQSRQVTILIAKQQGYESSEIGEQLGISGERVRQLVKDAKKKFVAFNEGGLSFRPQPAKTTPPVSTHHNIEPIGEGDQIPLNLPAPEPVRKPVVKRVDAPRLGGSIGKAIKQIFNHTNKESHIHDHGELTNAQKHLLASHRGSDHGIATEPEHQSTPADQQCCGLGSNQDAWRGYLGIGQAILNMIFLPLALVYQSIRGFQDNNRSIKRRSIMSFIATGVSKVIRCGYREEHPRPPN